MRLRDILFLGAVVFILGCTVWTSYQLAIVCRGDVPRFAQAGSYYWEVIQ